ncbi:MAG TPA: DUF481 domain-containing protein [Lysobacter sp.]
MTHRKQRCTVVRGLPVAVVVALAAAVLPAAAQQPVASPKGSTTAVIDEHRGWTGSGEFGYASASGNSRSQNINAKVGVGFEDDKWLHQASAGLLKSKGEVDVDRNADGIDEERYETTADRYNVQASSAYKLTQRSYLVGTVRYDHDEFNTYLWQGTAGLGYGYRWFDNERMRLLTEIGPAFRRVHNVDRGVEDDTVARGFVDFSYVLTPTTSVLNTFLVESGRLNTYVQNDIGLQVAMTDALALKAGYQVRHNSDVGPGFDRTDTLTTLNIVYRVD